VLLATTFLGVLGLWFAFTGYGRVVAPAPSAMVLFEALPPIHSLLDLQFLTAGRTVSLAVGLSLGMGLLVARAVLLSLWVSLILDSMAWMGGSVAWWPDWRTVLRRALRSLPAMVGLEGAYLALTLLAVSVAGSFLGELGVIAALVGGLYFLAFSAIAAVVEGASARVAARLSFRGARLPGPRHMLLTFSYLAVALFLSLVTPSSRVSQATPSFQVWAYVLFVNFLHVSVLGAFTFRWLIIRDRVIEDEAARRPVRTPARPRSG